VILTSISFFLSWFRRLSATLLFVVFVRCCLSFGFRSSICLIQIVRSTSI